jgi:hypothetical protein
MGVIEKDRDILTRTLWGEARGELRSLWPGPFATG